MKEATKRFIKYRKKLNDQQIEYLISLWQSGKTSKEISDLMEIGRTNVRAWIYFLGFQRFIPAYWTKEMIEYLKKNYQSIGDVELSESMEKLFPKNKPWTHKHVRKKRVQLNLHRTKEEIAKIRLRNIENGMYARGHANAIKTRKASFPEGTVRWYRHRNSPKLLPYMRYKEKIVPLPRALWMIEHNLEKIPNDHRVIQKVKGYDYSIENLEMVHITEISKYKNQELLIIKEINNFRKKVAYEQRRKNSKD